MRLLQHGSSRSAWIVLQLALCWLAPSIPHAVRMLLLLLPPPPPPPPPLLLYCRHSAQPQRPAPMHLRLLRNLQYRSQQLWGLYQLLERA